MLLNGLLSSCLNSPIVTRLTSKPVCCIKKQFYLEASRRFNKIYPLLLVTMTSLDLLYT